MLPTDDERPKRRYLLLVSRARYPFLQRLWAEDRVEAIMARGDLMLDHDVRNVEMFTRARFLEVVN